MNIPKSSTITPLRRMMMVLAGITAPILPHIFCEDPDHDSSYIVITVTALLLIVLATLRYARKHPWEAEMRKLEDIKFRWVTGFALFFVVADMARLLVDAEHGYRTALLHGTPLVIFAFAIAYTELSLAKKRRLQRSGALQ